MDKFATLIEILRDRAFQKSDQIAYTFLKNGETEEVSLTCQQLDLAARATSCDGFNVLNDYDRGKRR